MTASDALQEGLVGTPDVAKMLRFDQLFVKQIFFLAPPLEFSTRTPYPNNP